MSRPATCKQCLDCSGLGGTCTRSGCPCHGHLSEEVILRSVSGSASTAVLAEIEAHLDVCSECRDLVAAAAKAVPT